MKQRWEQLSKRFEALSRRERLMVLLGGVLVIALIGFSLIDGSLAKRSAFEKQVAQARADQAGARQQLESLSRQLAQDPDAVVRTRIAELRSEIERIDAEVRGVHRGLVPPERMAGVLESMLTRNSRVSLVALKTLPVTPLVERMEADAAERSVYKHGVELVLQGSYLDLLDYLVQLERLPWQMFWAKTEMDATGFPRVRLTVTVYTLSLDRKWLVV